MIKFFVSCIFILFCNLAYTQSVNSTDQRVEDILLEYRQKADSLDVELQKNNISDKQVLYLENARKTLKEVVAEMTKLENFNNEPIQKALMQPLSEYYDAFNFERDGKITNNLRYGFKNKVDFVNYYKISEALLLEKIIIRQDAALLADAKANYNAINNYINKNLKRLGISRAEYDKLSDNDKAILEKQFTED